MDYYNRISLYSLYGQITHVCVNVLFDWIYTAIVVYTLFDWMNGRLIDVTLKEMLFKLALLMRVYNSDGCVIYDMWVFLLILALILQL